MLAHSQDATCPAGGQQGLVEGDNVRDVDTEYSQIGEDDFDVIVTLTVETEYLSCAHRGLVLDDYQILEEAESTTRLRPRGTAATSNARATTATIDSLRERFAPLDPADRQQKTWATIRRASRQVERAPEHANERQFIKPGYLALAAGYR